MQNTAQHTISTSSKHRLLNRQLAKHLASLNADEFTKLQPFLNAVSDAYTSYDEDYQRLENTLELSSNELYKANVQLNDLNKALEVKVEERTQELNKALTKLSKSEEYYKALAANSTDITTILAPDGTAIYESESFYKTFDYLPEEIIGHNLLELIHPDDFERIAIEFAKVIETPGYISRDNVFRYRNKNGQYKTLEATATNMMDNDALHGIIVNSRDISSRVLAERKLLAQSHLLTAMYTTLPIAVFKFTHQGEIVNAFGRLFTDIGIDTQKLKGKSIGIYGAEILDHIAEAAKGNLVHFKNSTRLYNETQYYDNYIFRDDEADNSLIGFTIDITAQRSFELKMQEHNAQLEKINRELDQFSYIVSHDLKAPLRAISNLSVWIEEDIEDLMKDDTRKNFEMLRGRINRMESLINGILEYSKAGRSQQTKVSFAAHAVVDDVVNLLGVRDTTAVTIAPTLPQLKTDVIKFSQVLQNFISNALKYNNNPNPTLHINYSETDTHHVFSIKDNGPGISKEYHEKIFVIFQTLNARDKIESTGVGLAIVKKLVEEYQGRVWVESQEGQGAEFFFSWIK